MHQKVTPFANEKVIPFPKEPSIAVQLTRLHELVEEYIEVNKMIESMENAMKTARKEMQNWQLHRINLAEQIRSYEERLGIKR